MSVATLTKLNLIPLKPNSWNKSFKGLTPLIQIKPDASSRISKRIPFFPQTSFEEGQGEYVIWPCTLSSEGSVFTLSMYRFNKYFVGTSREMLVCTNDTDKLSWILNALEIKTKDLSWVKEFK